MPRNSANEQRGGFGRPYAMRLPDGLDLVLDGEATPIDDPVILDAVGALSGNPAG